MLKLNPTTEVESEAGDLIHTRPAERAQILTFFWGLKFVQRVPAHATNMKRCQAASSFQAVAQTPTLASTAAHHLLLSMLSLNLSVVAQPKLGFRASDAELSIEAALLRRRFMWTLHLVSFSESSFLSLTSTQSRCLLAHRHVSILLLLGKDAAPEMRVYFETPASSKHRINTMRSRRCSDPTADVGDGNMTHQVFINTSRRSERSGCRCAALSA